MQIWKSERVRNLYLHNNNPVVNPNLQQYYRESRPSIHFQMKVHINIKYSVLSKNKMQMCWKGCETYICIYDPLYVHFKCKV